MLAFIFRLFAKIWYFFSFFKFEQNTSNQKVSDQLKNNTLLKSSSRQTFFVFFQHLFRPAVGQKADFYAITLFSMFKNYKFLLKNAITFGKILTSRMVAKVPSFEFFQDILSYSDSTHLKTYPQKISSKTTYVYI
jgi:hypothetical protein